MQIVTSNSSSRTSEDMIVKVNHFRFPSRLTLHNFFIRFATVTTNFKFAHALLLNSAFAFRDPADKRFLSCNIFT